MLVAAELVAVIERIAACRDPKDATKFLRIGGGQTCRLSPIADRYRRRRCVLDPAKDAVYRAKFRSSRLADVSFARPHLSAADDRFDYGETHELAFGMIARTAFCMRLCRPGIVMPSDLAPQGEPARSEALWRKS